MFDDREQFEQFFMVRDGVVPQLELDWRLAAEGSWVLADDGGVTQILKRGTLVHPKDKYRKVAFAPNGYCRTVVGMFNTAKRYSMDTDFDKHLNRYQFTNSPIFSNAAMAMKYRTVLTHSERKFVTNLLMYLHAGNGRQESMMLAVRDAGYSANNVSSMLAKANLLLQQDRIMKLLSDQMKDAAEEVGITIKWVMKGIKELGDDANREDVRLAALKQGGIYLGLERKEAEEVAQLGSGYQGFNKQLGESSDKHDIDADELEAEFSIIEKDGDE